MSLTTTQIKLLTVIRGKIRKGDTRIIADKTGRTLTYVGMVLNPDSEQYNEDIVAEAVKIINEREQETKQLLESISAV